MHRAASDIAAKAKGTWSICDERQPGSLSRIRFDRYSIAIYVQTMDHVIANEFEGNDVTWIHVKFRWRIGILPGVDLEGALLRCNRLNWQWRKCHDQPSCCKEEK